MKIWIIPTVVLCMAANQSLAAAPSPGVPAAATLKAAFSMPVGSSGPESGRITVPSGAVVNVEDVESDRLLVDFAGAKAWVPRAGTDFDERLVESRAALQEMRMKAEQLRQQNQAIIAEQTQKANADLQDLLTNYVSPLDAGPYDYHRSVVDYFDECGNRYHIGVFGQRIYD